MESCLNCHHEQEVNEKNTFIDELGVHTICEECDSSYNLQGEYTCT